MQEDDKNDRKDKNGRRVIRRIEIMLRSRLRIRIKRIIKQIKLASVGERTTIKVTVTKGILVKIR